MDGSRDDRLGLLREVPLFAGLPEAALTRLVAGSILHRLPAGVWLFRQGYARPALHVIMSGRLEVVLETPPPERLLRLLGRTDVIGEIALITGTTTSASVRARRDSELLEIPSESFHALLRRHPDVALELMQMLARRLATEAVHGLPRGGSPQTVAVIDLRPVSETAAVVDRLAGSFGGYGAVAALGRSGLPGDTDPGRLVDDLERKHDTVLLFAAADDPVPWQEFCARQGDRLVCVMDAAGSIPRLEIEDRLAGCDLALTGRPSGRTGDHLDRFQARAHHWLDLPDPAAGAARLVRRLLGRSTGVVLSGGGARGFAHLGVMERLRGRGIVVDRIGGCSMGAFVAALAARGLSVAESLEVCRREFAQRNPFNDYTVPRVSMIRARKAAAMLERVLGTTAIENCATDYFCVSADLVSADLVVHRRGLLRDAVGASMSIPGFAPPIESGSRLLIDGGVLNNLPVDVMTATGEGPVFAVDVMGRTRLGLPGARPTLVETLARATVLSSWQRIASTRDQASLVLTPELGDVGLLDFRRLDAAVEAGRRAVDAAVEAGLL